LCERIFGKKKKKRRKHPLTYSQLIAYSMVCGLAAKGDDVDEAKEGAEEERRPSIRDAI
jgi:hypothetical protein